MFDNDTYWANRRGYKEVKDKKGKVIEKIPVSSRGQGPDTSIVMLTKKAEDKHFALGRHIVQLGKNMAFVNRTQYRQSNRMGTGHDEAGKAQTAAGAVHKPNPTKAKEKGKLPKPWPFPAEMTSAERMEWRKNYRMSMKSKEFDKWHKMADDIDKIVADILYHTSQVFPGNSLTGSLKEQKNLPPLIIVNCSAYTKTSEFKTMRAFITQYMKKNYWPLKCKLELNVF